jgi:hypothetical protein
LKIMITEVFMYFLSKMISIIRNKMPERMMVTVSAAGVNSNE